MKRSDNWRFGAMAAAASLLPAPAVLAQAVDNYEGTAFPKTTDTGIYSVMAGYSHRFKTDIDDGGEFSVHGFRTGAGLNLALTDQMRLDSGLVYELNSYDFDELGGFEPWDKIHTFRIRSLLHFKVDDQWKVYGGPLFSFSGEDGADNSHSFTGGGLVGAAYQVNENLNVGLVVGMMSQIEADARGFVFPTVDWTFVEQWSVKIGYIPLGSGGGVGGELAYQMGDQWRLSAGLQYQRRRFLLDDNGSLPDFVGEDTMVPVYAKATWEAAKNIELETFLGFTANGELKLETDEGHEVGSTDYDPAAIVGVAGRLRF